MNIVAPFSSRIFSVAASISVVLCSLSLLIFTISHTSTAKAESNAMKSAVPIPWDAELRGAVGLGIANDTAYFVVFSSSNLLYKVSLSSAKDWYKN